MMVQRLTVIADCNVAALLQGRSGSVHIPFLRHAVASTALPTALP